MSDRTVEIRPATASDADAVADVWLASFKATYSFAAAHSDDDVRGWIRSEVGQNDEWFVAVGAGGSVVAIMALEGDDLGQLYVHPDWLGRGVGSRLVELAKQQKPGGLRLYTFQVNDRARRFYERHGFVAEWFGDGSANEERQPDVRYVWHPGSG